MPLYKFRCPKCGYIIEKVWIPKEGSHKNQKWMDCPKCAEMAKKEDYSSMPIHLDREKKL